MWHWKQHQAAWDQSPGLHSVRLSTWHSQTTMAHFLLSGPETKERGQEAFVFICIWLRQGSTTHTKDHSLVCSVYVCAVWHVVCMHVDGVVCVEGREALAALRAHVTCVIMKLR